jgi:hypothetical protein
MAFLYQILRDSMISNSRRADKQPILFIMGKDIVVSKGYNSLDSIKKYLNQCIKMLQIALQYTLPRMKQATNEVSKDLRLFI